MKLFLVTGEFSDCDPVNLDYFIVADDVEACKALWLQAALGMFYSEDDQEAASADEDVAKSMKDIRLILPDVAGTPYEGEPRAIDWDSIEIVHEARA